MRPHRLQGAETGRRAYVAMGQLRNMPTHVTTEVRRPEGKSRARQISVDWEGGGYFSCLEGDFANKPFSTPVEMRLTPVLTGHPFNDPRAKTLARWPLHSRTAHLGPAED